MMYYALIETNPDKGDYNCTYIRHWEGDAESLREHMRNMSAEVESMDTVEIRPATEDEIAWYESEFYEDGHMREG